jgi:hypothetical protein
MDKFTLMRFLQLIAKHKLDQKRKALFRGFYLKTVDADK